jgi:hypothetical protein
MREVGPPVFQGQTSNASIDHNPPYALTISGDRTTCTHTLVCFLKSLQGVKSVKYIDFFQPRTCDGNFLFRSSGTKISARPGRSPSKEFNPASRSMSVRSKAYIMTFTYRWSAIRSGHSSHKVAISLTSSFRAPTLKDGKAYRQNHSFGLLLECSSRHAASTA